MENILSVVVFAVLVVMLVGGLKIVWAERW
ncbi:hypothetical protein LCGC14_2094840 [marine sediment metagenome]|uniref:Uncharacterized protein n=1 Tax=marine sediment metagenome TaxID=412755 RepID=A0A0F9EBX6_9ZZZZ